MHIIHRSIDLCIMIKIKVRGAYYTQGLSIFEAANNNSPEYITEILVRNSSLQERAALRYSLQAAMSYTDQTEFSKRAFSLAGPTAWNELPPELRHMPDIQTFKRALKPISLMPPTIN